MNRKAIVVMAGLLFSVSEQPAVTPARSLTDIFVGIAPGFIAAQLLATFAAWRLLPWLFRP